MRCTGATGLDVYLFSSHDAPCGARQAEKMFDCSRHSPSSTRALAAGCSCSSTWSDPVTVFLSNDATVVVLTPSMRHPRRCDALPYLFVSLHRQCRKLRAADLQSPTRDLDGRMPPLRRAGAIRSPSLADRVT